MFSNSRQVIVNGGNFLAVGRDYVQVQNRPSGIQILSENIAEGALHNSGERFDPPKCHPNTRTAVRQKIMDWVQESRSPSSGPNFMWVYGPAGSGKSAIAQSIAELCSKLGFLLSTFFFSRSAIGRRDDKRFVATIAYQVALSFPEARPFIEEAVERDPALLSRNLEAQLQALLIEPLSRLDIQTTPRPRLLIVDGLDECHDPRAQTTIIQAFTQSFEIHKFPFIILFASRAEYHIREAFNDKTFDINLCRIALDNTHWRPDDDIEEFLQSRFQKIRETHHMKSYLSPQWPSSESIEKLVAKSSGQFIYASTVIKYIEAHGYRPTDRLDAVLGLQSVENETPFGELDDLYRHILAAVEDYDLTSLILAFLLQPLPRLHFVQRFQMSLSYLDSFFSLKTGSVYLALSNLHSIIMLDKTSDIKIIHASFEDFLMDRSRSGRFFLDHSLSNAGLAMCCIKNITQYCDMENQASMSTVEHSIYKYSQQAMIEYCVRADAVPGLLQSLYSFDIRHFIMKDFNIQKDLPRYFKWLSSQIRIRPGAQVVFQQHLKIFGQCLLSEIQQNQYSKETISCFITFEGLLLAEWCPWLLGEEVSPTERAFLLLGSTETVRDYPNQYHDEYIKLLRYIFLDGDRWGAYDITVSTHTRTMVVVLEQLRSMWPRAHNKLPPQILSDLDYRIYFTTKVLPIALCHIPLSNDLFDCVSSILSELESGSFYLGHWRFEGCEPKLWAALHDYLKRCKSDPLLSVSTSLKAGL